MTRHLAALALVLSGLTRVAFAQSLAPSPLPSLGNEAFRWASPSMGVSYEVVVRTPPGAKEAAPGTRFGALVVTDGYRALLPAADAASSLESQGMIEPLYIISIGVAIADGEEEWVRRRVYEFSNAWDLADRFGEDVRRVCSAMKSLPGKCVGGAPKFLAAIVDEIIPQVAKRFPIDTARLGLFGVSAGGFFVSWAMLQDKSPFTRYIINSPAMAYGNAEIFRDEAQFASTHKDLPVSVYLATGSLEIDDPFLEGIGQIASGHARFAAALRSRKYPGLRLYNEILSGMGHGDATGSALVRGLRVLYAKAAAN